MYYPSNQILNEWCDVEAVVTENACDGYDGNLQTTQTQGPLNAILVIDNVNTRLAVIFVVISEKKHYRLILMKLSISRSLPKSTNTSSFRMTVELSGTPIICCFIVSSLFSISSKLRRMVTKLKW